jgi:Alpha/beta hydrolase family
VVFVHGLGGGVDKSWGQFRALLASDPKFSADFTFFDYQSLFRRRFSSPPLYDVVKYLVDQVRATGYRSVVFAGHSMGGNLARAAVKHILDNALPSNPSYIHVRGLVLFASPMLGSSYYLTQATKDGRYVAAYSDQLADIMRFFHERIDTQVEQASLDRTHVPTFGAIAMRDRVVRPMSSQELIPDLQVRRINTGHKKIIKPESHQSESYRWLVECVEKCTRASRLAAPIRPRNDGSNQIIARYSGSGRHPDWQEKYRAACAAFEADAGVTVRNAMGSYESVNLSVCVIDAEEILQGKYNDLLLHEASAQAQNDKMSLYVGAIGQEHVEATGHAEAIVPPKAGSPRYIVGFADAMALESTIFDWLRWTLALNRLSLDRRPSPLLSDRSLTSNLEGP